MTLEEEIAEIKLKRQGFFLQGKDPSSVILFVHGLGGTACTGASLGPSLVASTGFSFESFLLPGHASQPEDLLHCPYEKWLGALEKEYDRLAQVYQKVYLGGVSLGALLSLRLAEERNVAGVFALSAPLYYAHPLLKAVQLVAPFHPYHSWKPNTNVDPRKMELLCYNRIPLSSVNEITRLAKATRHDLKAIEAPLFLALGERDFFVSPRFYQTICQKSSAKGLRILLLKNEGHGLLFGPSELLVFAAVSSFLSDLRG
jgi:carboxylesterase